MRASFVGLGWFPMFYTRECISSANISIAWAPTTNLGYKTGNCSAGTELWTTGKLLREMRAMGCFASDFPTFLFNVNAAATFLERSLQLVQLACTYIYFSFFSPPSLHWARLRALGLT